MQLRLAALVAIVVVGTSDAGWFNKHGGKGFFSKKQRVDVRQASASPCSGGACSSTASPGFSTRVVTDNMVEQTIVVPAAPPVQAAPGHRLTFTGNTIPVPKLTKSKN